VYTGGGAFCPFADGVMVGFAILGAVDDWEGIHGKRKGDGMRARTKFASGGSGVGTAYVLKYMLDVPDMYLPGYFFEVEIGLDLCAIAAFIIVAESNAVNFTDGLDGLAGLDRCHCHCRIWRHCIDAGTGLSRAFLFHFGWRAFRLFMVQRPSRRN
jgi:UDP-N-acetylmuramyl pentapeptide phosphotransferase/UDP-N-acetylglucosamine-1-phosphate transferase